MPEGWGLGLPEGWGRGLPEPEGCGMAVPGGFGGFPVGWGSPLVGGMMLEEAEVVWFPLTGTYQAEVQAKEAARRANEARMLYY